MNNINLPKYVRQVLFTIQSHGHMVCLVGGCVRDTILGLQPNDWDISTSALPEQILDIFPDSVTTGMKHGTVGVKQGSHLVEVTTFRSEGVYIDHRHPGAVSFVGDLTTDLGRRDFTMNAIAIPADGIATDPFGGMEDIEKKLVRCVGDPDQRFEEDALRMFRALRFSAKLGFAIEENTMAAIGRKAPLAASLAAERVCQELEKTLMTQRPETVFQVLKLGLMDSFLQKRPEKDDRFRRLGLVNKKAPDRWCALCLCLLEQGCIASAGDLLRDLHLDSRTIRGCEESLQLLEKPLPEDTLAWKRLLARWGVDAASRAAACTDGLFGGVYRAALRAVLKSGECFSLQNLAISGEDLKALGMEGRQIGAMLDFLLDFVMEHPEHNRREFLQSLATATEE